MSIKRNTLYNLGGAVAPLALTIVSVPLYLRAIGEARYGVLALVWLLLGYFGLFDLGLSTATANALARSRTASPTSRGPIFKTSLLTNAGLGLVIGTLVLMLGPPILARMGNVAPALRAEILTVLPWLAASIPLVTVGGVLTGVLTAHERFGTANAIALAGTACFQLAPLWAAYTIGPNLPAIVPVAVMARAIPVALTAVAALRLLPLKGARYDRIILAGLLTYGGWVMVTNLLGPVLISVDQFVIASLLGASAVAHYAIAYSLAVRLQILPTALMQTMFPRLSRQDGRAASALASQALRSITLVMTTLCVPAILVARPFLSVWINPEFGARSGPVAEILLMSVWVNGLAFVPFALLQAQGRPDAVAKIHALEIVPFLLALYAGIHLLGLVGAALAWAMRTLLDAALLFRASPLPAAAIRPLTASAVMLLTAWAIAATQHLGPVTLLVAAFAAASALAGWTGMTDPAVRGIITTIAARMRRR